MTSVNVTTTKNTVTVNGETRVVTVKTAGPQGPAFSDGDKGDVTVSSNGTAISINNSAVTSAKIADGAIVNADINASAAIALSKLATGALPTAITVTSANISDLSIVDADISGSAAISLSKLATGALPTAITVTSANISDLSIVNADINASAAIAGTKISPDFGSQNIVTTGTGATGALGVTGDITVSGTVDGRDVATDGTKLDGIETGATADQTKSDIDALGIAASTATTLATSRNIGGVSFNGSANIDLPGVNTAGNQNTSGNAATATTLQTARTIAGTSFDGSANIDISYTNLTNKLSVGDGGLTQNNFTDALKTKLDGIETAATADQTAAEIKTLLDSNGIVNSNVDASAAIAGTKISPDFGSQNIITTGSGSIFGNGLELSGVSPTLFFTDTNHNPDFKISCNIQRLAFEDVTNSATRLQINSDGHVDVTGNLDVGAGVDVTGNITVTGTVDGVDIATRDTLFGGLTSSSGVLSNGVTATTQSASDNSTKVATTAYTDTAISNLVNSAPSTLDTLKELSDALGSDPNFATTVTNSIATKMPLAGGQFTGNITFSGTQTVDGRDLSVDGSKLDGIESGATADQTASEILSLLSDQDITTTGQLSAKDLILSDTTPVINLNDSTANPDYQINNTNGVFNIRDTTNSVDRLVVNTDGHVDITGNLDVGSGLDVTGNITVSGTVDGRDVATDGTKLDGIESNATADQTASEIVALVADQTIAPSEIDMEDNEKIKLGTGDDLQIFHDGTHSRIYNDTATSLNLTSADFTFNSANNSEQLARFTGNGSCEFYFNNSKKLETATNGVTVTGRILPTGNGNVGVVHNDNIKSVFGNSDDLQIYHDSSSNRNKIECHNGRELRIDKGSGTETMAIFKPDAEVQLFYDDSKKFETTSTGAEVFSTTDALFRVFNTGDGTAKISLHNTGSADFHIENTNAVLTIGTDETSIKATDDGAVELYFNGSKKAFTYADGLHIDTGVLRGDDNALIKLGNGGDLEIYHDSSTNDGFIKELGTGRLQIWTSSLHLKNQAGDEINLVTNENGNCELWFDNSKKFETTSAGVTVTGTITATSFSGETVVGDPSPQLGNSLDMNGQSINGGDSAGVANNRIKLGASDDLQIYHNGSHSYLDNSTGDLNLRTTGSGVDVMITAVDDIILTAGDDVEIKVQGSENAIKCIGNGAVELYYDNSKRFETSADGCIFSGSTNTTASIQIKGTEARSAEIRLIADDGDDFTDTVRLHQSINGNFYLQNLTASATFESMLVAAPNGAVELYYDNALRLETMAAGARVKRYGGGATTLFIEGAEGSTAILDMFADDGDDNADKFRLQASTDGSFSMQNYASGSWENNIRTVGNGAVELYHDNSKRLETTSWGVSLTGTLVASSNIKTASDTGKLMVGAGDDLQIYHDGSHSYITEVGTGHLYFGASGYRFNNAAQSESIIQADQDGAVELYYDNSKKFETTSTGVNCTAGLDVQGSTTLQDTFLSDNDKLNFGGGNDLQIYHSGTQSYVTDQGTGNLNLQGTSKVVIGNAAHNENMAQFFADGAVELYYNNVKKFETTSIGVTITGDLKLPDNENVRLGDSNDLILYHNGTNSLIENATGNLIINSAGELLLQKYGTGESMVRAVPDNTVELRFDNVKKLETTSTGVTVTGQIISDGLQMGDSDRAKFGSHDDLQIYHDGSHSRISEVGTGKLILETNGSEIQLNKGTTENMIKCFTDGAVELYYDNVQSLRTNSTGIMVQKTASGTNASVSIDATNGGQAKLELKTTLSGTNRAARIDMYNQNSLQWSIFNDYEQDGTNDFSIRHGAEKAIRALTDAGVELYYDNTKRLETVTDGAKCTGALEIFGVNNGVTAPLSANNRLRFTDNDSTTASAQPVGTIEWYTNDGNNRGISGFISVQSETDQGRGQMIFGTGTAPAPETMRLDQNGRLHIGKTTAISGENRLTVMNESSSKVAHFHHNHNSQRACLDCTNGYATGGQSAIMIEFRRADLTSVGGIFASTSNVQYNTASDYRLKENQVAISDGITRLKELKPYKFNFKENKDKIVDGFFAHEVSSVVPEAITGTKDEVDENNDPVYQGIDQSKLVPLLVAAVQELIGRVEKLEGA